MKDVTSSNDNTDGKRSVAKEIAASYEGDLAAMVEINVRSTLTDVELFAAQQRQSLSDVELGVDPETGLVYIVSIEFDVSAFDTD